MLLRSVSALRLLEVKASSRGFSMLESQTVLGLRGKQFPARGPSRGPDGLARARKTPCALERAEAGFEPRRSATSRVRSWPDHEIMRANLFALRAGLTGLWPVRERTRV